MRYMTLSCAILLSFVLGCNGSAPESGRQNNTSTHQMAGQEVAAAFIAQGPGQRVADAIMVEKFNPFAVYTDKGSRDNHFVPSGFMPNGECLSLHDAWQEECHSGKTCMKVDYDTLCSAEDQKWAGIYWLNPANNWGKRKGGFNLQGAQKLTFWAKGEEGGERIEEFTIGGITGDYPDTDMALIGPVILSKEWRQYTIDLRGKDLSHISGGFSWTTNVEVNPRKCIFYLDDIRYE